MPYYLIETVTVLPAFIWIYIVLGGVWALAVLPRADWSDRPLLVMTAFALGSMWLSAMMFVLGSFNRPHLTLPNVLGGVAMLTVIGTLGWLARLRLTAPPAQTPHIPLTRWEITVILLIVLGVIIRWVVVSYWAFTAYDALWVYGYEGRLYFLKGFIPNSIGYYPQFLPLQYTFGQLVYGGISDHAARAVLPFLQLGTVLAVYSFGNRLFNRSTGLVLAGIWFFGTHVAQWSRMGDLEIALTFLWMASTTFLLLAWKGERPTHYAVLSGVMFGTAMWIKPTAAGFALGVILLTVTEGIRLRFSLKAWLPLFKIACVVAVTSAPLGGVWYLRNLLLGHPPIEFPSEFWYTLAERGGGQVLPILLSFSALVLSQWNTFTDKARRGASLGMGLLLLGILPSASARFWDIADSNPLTAWYLFPSLSGLPRFGILEYALIAVGIVLVGRSLTVTMNWNAPTQQLLLWVMWLVIPYFALYFWRYSYHYRLRFAILPLLLLPLGVVIAHWFSASKRKGISLAIVALAVPSMIIPFHDIYAGWDWLWSGKLLDDTAKQAIGNPALMWMVDGFRIYEREQGQPPVVIAPNVQRLPFFFPLADIRIDHAPTRLHELEGATYFVNSHPDGTGLYQDIPLHENQVLSALGREDIMRKAWWKDDGIFRYEIYELFTERRFIRPETNNPQPQEVRFGDFAQLIGHNISSLDFPVGEQRTLELLWQAHAPAEQDYMIFIHLLDAHGNMHQNWDAPVALDENGNYYTTRVWEAGEYIIDRRRIRLTNTSLPLGEGYQIAIGMYDLASGERVPITLDGVATGDTFIVENRIHVLPPPTE